MMNIKKYLALDLGSIYGFCEIDILNNQKITKREFLRRCKSGANDRSKYPLSIRLYSLRRFLSRVSPNYIFYEDVVFGRRLSLAAVQGCFKGVMLEWSEENVVPEYPYKVQQIKKFATGYGGGPKADKYAMRISAESFGFIPNTKFTDEVDAFWILLLGLTDRGLITYKQNERIVR